MTEGFRQPPPTGPAGFAGPTAAREEVLDTVQRIMGDDIAPPQNPATPPAASRSGHTPQDSDTSTAEVAKRQAADVADTAKQAGVQVADTVKEQAGQVTAEAGRQARQLLSQAQSELSEQAGATQQRVSEGLRSLADELSGMARNSEQDGVATDLARQAADKARQAAGWMADRDPGTLLDEVRSFARKKPGTYLAIALGAGVLTGRLTRGLTAPTADSPQQSPAGSTAPPTQVTSGGRQALTGYPANGATGYDPEPVTDPLLPVPPAAGLGATGALGGPRGDLAP